MRQSLLAQTGHRMCVVNNLQPRRIASRLVAYLSCFQCYFVMFSMCLELKIGNLRKSRMGTSTKLSSW